MYFCRFDFNYSVRIDCFFEDGQGDDRSYSYRSSCKIERRNVPFEEISSDNRTCRHPEIHQCREHSIRFSTFFRVWMFDNLALKYWTKCRLEKGSKNENQDKQENRWAPSSNRKTSRKANGRNSNECTIMEAFEPEFSQEHCLIHCDSNTWNSKYISWVLTSDIEIFFENKSERWLLRSESEHYDRPYEIPETKSFVLKSLDDWTEWMPFKAFVSFFVLVRLRKDNECWDSIREREESSKEYRNVHPEVHQRWSEHRSNDNSNSKNSSKNSIIRDSLFFIFCDISENCLGDNHISRSDSIDDSSDEDKEKIRCETNHEPTERRSENTRYKHELSSVSVRDSSEKWSWQKTAKRIDRNKKSRLEIARMKDIYELRHYRHDNKHSDNIDSNCKDDEVFGFVFSKWHENWMIRCVFVLVLSSLYKESVQQTFLVFRQWGVQRRETEREMPRMNQWKRVARIPW